MLDFGWALVPKTPQNRGTIAGKISSGGVPGRLGDAALRFCSSRCCSGPLPGRFCEHPGPLVAPKMAPKSDFRPILASKMTLRSESGPILDPKMAPELGLEPILGLQINKKA